jgi:hypothetical protein
MTITKAFILEDDDFKVIEQKAREMGDASASAALRAIIREWNAQSNPPVASVPRPFAPPAERRQPFVPMGG